MLGTSEKPLNRDAKRMALRVFRKKVESFISKLYIKNDPLERCESRSHWTREQMRDWLHSRFSKATKEEFNEKTLKKLEEWLRESPRLSLITVVERDRTGIIQTTEICVDCLYRKLENYSSFKNQREPSNLGVLFLNEAVKQ